MKRIDPMIMHIRADYFEVTNKKCRVNYAVVNLLYTPMVNRSYSFLLRFVSIINYSGGCCVVITVGLQ